MKKREDGGMLGSVYREIDQELVDRDADDFRITCPACEQRHRPSVRRCACGYDLTREDEDPAQRFKRELRRSALRLMLFGSVFVLAPWIHTFLQIVLDAPHFTPPGLFGWVICIAGIALVGQGISERRRAM